MGLPRFCLTEPGRTNRMSLEGYDRTRLRNILNLKKNNGADGRTRTADLLITKKQTTPMTTGSCALVAAGSGTQRQRAAPRTARRPPRGPSIGAVADPHPRDGSPGFLAGAVGPIGWSSPEN